MKYKLQIFDGNGNTLEEKVVDQKELKYEHTHPQHGEEEIEGLLSEMLDRYPQAVRTDVTEEP